jgi:hypothetical protein
MRVAGRMLGSLLLRGVATLGSILIFRQDLLPLIEAVFRPGPDLLDQQSCFIDFDLHVSADDETGCVQPVSAQAQVRHANPALVGVGVAHRQSPRFVARFVRRRQLLLIHARTSCCR